MGRRSRVAGLVLAAICLGLTVVLPGIGLAAPSTWRITVSPASVQTGVLTTINVTFSNLGGPTGNDPLGCVRLQIPSAFTVLPPVLVASPPKTVWLATGTNTMQLNPASGGDRLSPSDPSSSVKASISIIAGAPGTYTWTATAYESQSCTKAFTEVQYPAVSVHGAATPSPTPTPTPSPTPTPTPSPTPTPTPSPTPTPTPTPTPDGPSPTPGGPSPTPTLPVDASPTPTPSSASGTSSTPEVDPTALPTTTTPPGPGASDPPADGSPPPGAIGSTLLMAGFDPTGGGSGGDGGSPSINLSSAFTNPLGQGFAWAVPGLVLSVPGLLIVIAVVLAQTVSAFAWLPIVRRRMGALDVRRRPARRTGSSAVRSR